MMSSIVGNVQGLGCVVRLLSLSQDCLYMVKVCTTKHCSVTETPDITLAPFTRGLVRGMT